MRNSGVQRSEWAWRRGEKRESKTGMRQGRVRMEKGIWIEREQIAVVVWSINIPLTCAVYIEKK